MSYQDVGWQYKDPLTTQKLNQMVDNTVWTSEHRMVGAWLKATGTSTIIAYPGKINIGADWLIRDTTATLTAEDANDWYSLSGGEGSATAMYIVAYNSAGIDWDIKFRLSGPAYSDTSSGTSTGYKMYDKEGAVWLRYIGVIHNASGSDFIGSPEPLGQDNYGKRLINAWVNFDGTQGQGSMIKDSYNVSSIADIGTGRYTITWDTDFASVNYVISGAAQLNGVEGLIIGIRGDVAITTGAIQIEVVDANQTAKDPTVVMVKAIGDQ